MKRVVKLNEFFSVRPRFLLILLLGLHPAPGGRREDHLQGQEAERLHRSPEE